MELVPKSSLRRKTTCSDELVEDNALFRIWLRCIRTHLNDIRGNYTKLRNEMEGLSSPCNQPYAEILSIKEYVNSDEAKYHISPIVFTSNNTIVSLGVGHDIAAEEKLGQAMGKDNVQFFGADPIQEINKDLYSKIGKFFPFAVAGSSGYGEATVFDAQHYHAASVVYVDAVYFLTKMVGLKFYDSLWIDAEGGERGMFHMFFKGGAFDQNGIIICQFNMEMHIPQTEREQQQFHDFIYRIVDDERYGFFFSKNVGHVRMYFVNFFDESCTRKYVPRVFNASQLCP